MTLGEPVGGERALTERIQIPKDAIERLQKKAIDTRAVRPRDPISFDIEGVAGRAEDQSYLGLVPVVAVVVSDADAETRLVSVLQLSVADDVALDRALAEAAIDSRGRPVTAFTGMSH